MSLVGVTFIGAALLLLPTQEVPRLLVFLGLVVLAERIGIPLPRGGEFVVTTMVVATAMLCLPTSAAILAAGLGTLTGEIVARKPWYRMLFNVGQVATATGTASLVWRRLWGDGDLVPHPDRPEMIPAALAALSVYYLINTGLVSGVLAISGRGGFFRVWWENHRGVFLPHFGMQIMGVLFAGALVQDWRLALLLTFPALVMWRNYRQVRILERTTAEAESARAVAEDLAARWEVMADVGLRLASTIEPERLVPIVARLAADHCADGALVVAAGHRAVAFRGRYTQEDFPTDGDSFTRGIVRPHALIHGEYQVGTMSLVWAERGPTDEQQALCEMISDRSALALQNAILGVRASEVEAVREVSRLKSELVTKVSHDLTTPLGVILGYAEMLAGRASDRKTVQWMAEKISGSARHLARLVDDLLDAGRLESGRFTLDLQSHDLRELCTEAIETARVAHAGPRFELDLPEAPLPVRADPVRVRQILLNLLSNAARYGPPDGRIRLRAGQTADVVAVTVEDEGAGIPPAERERVFDKFYRVSATSGAHRKGLGLGLSIARDLVTAHHGEIWIESGEWGGARFHIALPLAAGSDGSAEAPSDNAAT